MYITIYFNDKPLFLCNEITGAIEPYLHHDDSVLVDEFSTPAINSIIHEMNLAKIHAGIIVHPDLEALKKAVFKKFDLILAAGGLVFNENNQALFIFRLGKWDLPKGKLDDGESLEACALREVQEETALQNVELQHFLRTTWHTYSQNGKHFLKETHWYRMTAKGIQHPQPQTEEDITSLKWAAREGWSALMENSYSAIREVLESEK